MTEKQINSMEELMPAYDEARDSKSHFYSTAQILFDALTQADVFLPKTVKIFCEYALPGKMSPEQFEKIMKEPGAFYKIKTSAGLASRISEPLMKQMGLNADQYSASLKEYSKFLRANNPDLAGTTTNNMAEEVALCFGAAYGYGPKEIQYFIDTEYRGKPMLGNNADYEKIEKALHLKWDKYRLHPDTMKAILTAIKEKQDRDSVRAFQNFQEARGYYDY